jgi:SAM-dependent methyltransferase
MIDSKKHNYIINYINFILDFYKFKKLTRKWIRRFTMDWNNIHPYLDDKTQDTSFDRHYIYHTGWAARVLKKIKPPVHIDIGSSLYFVSIVSAFIPIKFYDIRPPLLSLQNVTCLPGNLHNLPFKSNSVSSISCMHTIEHIGLGRYGDPINPDGDLLAIEELKRVLAKNGSLLFVVPIGKKAIIQFNAHRIYTVEQIKQYFKDLVLEEFSLIPEQSTDGGLVYNPSKQLIKKQTYACGCFWFKKK